MTEHTIIRPAQLPPPGAALPAPDAPLGRILIHMNVVTEDHVREALKIQAEKGGRIGEILAGMKACSETDVARALAAQLDLPFAEKLQPKDIPPELLMALPIAFAKQFRVLPLYRDGDAVAVATADPINTAVLDDLGIVLKASIEPVVSDGLSIIDAINQSYDRLAREAEMVMDSMGAEEDELANVAHELEEPEDLLDVDDEAPIIRLVNALLAQAVKERASDIHIEPGEKDITVRFRVDGVLYEVLRPPKRYQAKIASRIKIMGGLNIAEKRLPQDGRIRVKIAGKDIDIRLSTLPITHGERLVMRLLDKSAVLLDLNTLGFSEDRLAHIISLINKSHGIMLVTGPTGSGKTTTLYSCLAAINTPDLNIITIEDPVEYQMKGISQIPVNSKIGLTFAAGLRSILRQDPDVVLIGEIRDLETAEIAIQASLTGHLVFSTLHTNDSASSVTRLVDMGVEAYLVSSSLIGVLAQRLVRRICTHCREKYVPSDAEISEIGLQRSQLADNHVYRAIGCPKCLSTGYSGREGIYELLTIDDAMRQLVLRAADAVTIKHAAAAKGMLSLRDDGARKVALGITTIDEVMRVTQDDSAG